MGPPFEFWFGAAEDVCFYVFRQIVAVGRPVSIRDTSGRRGWRMVGRLTGRGPGSRIDANGVPNGVRLRVECWRPATGPVRRHMATSGQAFPARHPSPAAPARDLP